MNRLIATVLGGLIAFACAGPAGAHDPELEAKALLEAKLKSPWIRSNGFLTDYDKALDAAKRTEKPIFAYFTLSYLQHPLCDEVETGVLATPEFRKFGEGVVLFTHIVSGLGGKHSNLLREKGGTEVPLFLVLDTEGRVSAKRTTGFTVKGFEETLKAGRELQALRARVEKTLDERIYLLAQDMDLGNLKLQIAREGVKGLGELDEARKTAVEGALLRLEILTAASEASGSLDRAIKAGKLFAEMWAAGRVPNTDEHAKPFFLLILEHAEASKDGKLFRRALEMLRERFSGKPGFGDFLKMQAERLRRLEPAEGGDVDEEGDDTDDGAR